MKFWISFLAFLFCISAFAEERPFNGTIEYKLSKDNFAIANVIEQVTQTATTYKITSQIQAVGLATFFQKGKLERVSEGEKTKAGPQTLRFQETRSDKTNLAIWDATNQRFTFQPADPHETLPAAAGVTDRLNLAYLFALGKPINNDIKVTVTNGKRLDQYHYRKMGTERLETPIGKLETIHFTRQIVGDDNQVEFWIAPNLGYLPIRVRVQDNKNGILDQWVTKITPAPASSP